MIKEITWNLEGKLPYNYIRGIEYFKNNSKIEFKKGLNILTGDNGCGKSTLVNIIKYYFLEKHGNLPLLDLDEYDILKLDSYSEGFPDGINIVASYSTPTISMNNQIELSSTKRITRTSIEFFSYKGSQGENTMREYNRCVDTLYNNNSSYENPFDLIKRSIPGDLDLMTSVTNYYTRNNIKDRIPCMIMDEPDNSVSITNLLSFQKELDQLVKNCSFGMQVIMVLHSPILLIHFLDNPKVNYIEMTSGYLDEIRKIKENMMKNRL